MTQPTQRGGVGVVARAQVFVSHASADAEWVRQISLQVGAMGIHPYLAEHDRQPGTVLSEKVQKAIGRSAAIVVLLTRAGYDSPYVQQEVGYALAKGVLVVPLVAPEIASSNLGMLDGIEYLPFDFNDPVDALPALTETLQHIAATQTAPRVVTSPVLLAPQPGLRIQGQAQIDLQFTPAEVLIGTVLAAAVVTLLVIYIKEGGKIG